MPPCAKTQNASGQSRKNKKILTPHSFNHLRPPAAAKRTEKQNPACYNISRKSRGRSDGAAGGGVAERAEKFQMIGQRRGRKSTLRAGPSPARSQRKSRGNGTADNKTLGGRETWHGQRSARFQRAVSPSVATCFPHARKSLVASDQPTRHRKQIHKTPRQSSILSPTPALARPASSSQVIENKNTIEMNETRGVQNRAKHPENMAYHDIL